MRSYRVYLYLAINLVALATTYAQQTSVPSQGNDSSFDVRTCGEKINLCYDLLNDIDPLNATKAEKCASVFSVADCLVSLQQCNYAPELRPLLVKFIEVNVPGGVSNCSDQTPATSDRCQAGIENCHNILNGILRNNVLSQQQKCAVSFWFSNCLYSVEQCGLEETARPMILKAIDSSLSVSNCSHPEGQQVTSTTTRPSTTTPIREGTSTTTYAQQTSTQSQVTDSSFDVRTCGEKTNLCYYLLNDIDPLTATKAEKCASVFSVADCLESLQQCNYVPALRPLLVKFIEVNVPGGVSNCSDQTPETSDRCQAGIQNCHNILNGILRNNVLSQHQKCAVSFWFSNCLYSVEQCGLEEAARPMILKATDSSLSVSNCSHPEGQQVTRTTTRPSTTTPITRGTSTTTYAQQTSTQSKVTDSSFDVRTSTKRPISSTTIATQKTVNFQHSSTVGPVTSSNSCFGEQFKCGNGRCVNLRQVCNGRNDCGDNTDETACNTDQLEIVYELGNLFKEVGCDEVLNNCMANKFESVLQNPSVRPNFDAICSALGSSFRCAVYERCSLNPQDREKVASLMEKSFQLSTQGKSCTIPRSRFGDGPNCVDSCQGKKSGNYQSCKGCNMYVTCVGPIMYDSRPCPADLVWDDELKKCTYISTTCYKELLP